ncbi:putative mpv17 pmp22 family protein [Fonsecaea pedrosoi]|nr:putative mpv17 pmp22 family protein [Fonsecaea pedrosoi]
MIPRSLRRICRWHPFPRYRSFSRNVFTKDQIKTAELQKTPHTPNQVVTEVPHSTEASVIDVPSPLWYHRLGPVKDFFSWFSRMQRRRPLGIALATSLATYLCGDLLAQEVGGEPYDSLRTLRMITVGGLASIPGYKWVEQNIDVVLVTRFLFLGTHFNYASKWTSIAVKVAIQQFFFAPIFNTYFFGMQALLTGEAPSVVIHRIVSAVPESVVSSAKFWPAVTAVNFTLVPAHLRFAFSGFFAVIWQTYLSFLNRREEKTGPQGTLADQARQKLYEDAPSASVADVLDGID